MLQFALVCGVLPWQQERGSHTESRGNSHNVGHHHIRDEHQHQGEGHDPLDRQGLKHINGSVFLSGISCKKKSVFSVLSSLYIHTYLLENYVSKFIHKMAQTSKCSSFKSYSTKIKRVYSQ